MAAKKKSNGKPNGKTNGKPNGHQKYLVPAIVQAQADRDNGREVITGTILQGSDATITPERISDILWSILTFDFRRILTSQGTIVPFHLLDERSALAIGSIEVLEEFSPGFKGKPRLHIGYTKKLRVSDRLEAARLLLMMNGWLNGGGGERSKTKLAELYAAVYGEAPKELKE